MESARSKHLLRLLMICRRCVLGTLAVVAAFQATMDVTSAQEAAELPRLSEMNRPPSAEELLEAEPYDWIVLKQNQAVIVANPVYPRPDTLEKMAAEREELEASRPQGQQDRARKTQRLEQLKYIEINLKENRAEDYRITANAVEQIISFEQLMLERVDLLLDDGDISRAYELLMQVDQLAPGWEEAVPRFENLLLRESQLRDEEGDLYASMALLDELARRNRNNPDLPVRFGELLDSPIQTAIDARDYGRARYLIRRLSRHFPENSVAVKYTNLLRAKAAELVKQAAEFSQKGQHAEAARIATEAEDILPTSGNERAQYTQMASRHQYIRVAVQRFADDNVVSPIPLEADRRHRELTVVPLFEPSRANELTYFQSSFFEKWDPADLGRRVVFHLRTTRPYWQTQPLLTSNEVADTLISQLNPDLDSYNPRLASFIREFSVRSPTELQIDFSRVPLNLEAMFRFPLRGIPDEQYGQPDARPRILSTRFMPVVSDDDVRSYRRVIPEPDGLNSQQYHVAEIIEHQFASRHEELQAFRRGDVDVLPYLRPWEVDAFKASPQAFVQQYALPQTHVIVFNPRSEAVQNTQIRRSLSLSINRDGILKNIILRDPKMKYGRITSGAWHSESYASSPLVDDPEYNIRLGFALRFAAEAQLKIPEKLKVIAAAEEKANEERRKFIQDNPNAEPPPVFDADAWQLDHADEIKAATDHIKLPQLTLVCDPDEVVVEAVEKMVAVWARLGFDIKLVMANESGERLSDDGWDMMYRRVSLKEPLLDLWPLLTTDETFDISRLSAYPDWMRQELVSLDYAVSFLDARERMFTIHRHIAAQAFLIPLWEVDQFIAFQRNISGFEERPMSVYHNVERWSVRP